MILGGFLMLPSTFDNDAFLKVSELFIGTFAAIVLAMAFSATGFLAFIVRNPFFHVENLYLPCLTSCSVGLLTLFWDFLISRRYVWNTASKLTVIAAGIGTLVYGILLLWTQRKIHKLSKRNGSMTQSELLRPSISNERRGEQWGDQLFYQNYVQNMFPASLNPSTGQPELTDEELQRQQMLMLLQPTDQAAAANMSRNTFRIDWQGQDQEDEPPQDGYYAPRRNVSETSTAFAPSESTSQHLRPWDGVWRGQEPPRSHSASSGARLAPNG